MGYARVATFNGKSGNLFQSLAAGLYSIRAIAPFGGPSDVKVITLHQGHASVALDFRLQTYSTISGTVLDERREPIPDVDVFLIGRQYEGGTLRHVIRDIATTDDTGAYRLERVEPGRSYFVLAKEQSQRVDTMSSAPADMKLRKPARFPTFFPDSDSVQGASPLNLRPGEQREVDIRMLRSPSYCIEAILEAEGVPGQLRFGLDSEPNLNSSLGGVAPLRGQSGPDGRIRVCNLHSGGFRITTTRPSVGVTGAPALFGVALVTITDHDPRPIVVVAQPGVRLTGRVMWEPGTPDQPMTSKVSIRLDPLLRMRYSGEILQTEASIGEEFSLQSVPIGHYAVVVSGLPKGVYTKDVRYGGLSIANEALRLGTATGDADLLIAVAPGAGSVRARVKDRDGNAAPHSNVVIVPASFVSEPELASVMNIGQADQDGLCTSRDLAPGKYLAFATTATINRSPESIARLARALSKATELEVGLGATVQMALEAKSID